MRIELEFFSRLREATGVAKISRTLPAGTTAGSLLAQIQDEFPGLKEWLPHIRVAVGVDWVGHDHLLRDGDVVLIMPPVSGG